MATKNRSVDSIFMEAMEIDSRSAREQFLNDACGSDATLRQRVDKLIEASGRASRFLEEPIVDVEMTQDRPPEDAIGKMVGPYKLLQQIGEGGMGVVYMAEQHEPVKRRVAVKIIKPGMDSSQVVARFEAERQALAMMDHPNIAKVLDAGTTEVGHPFFVMELVKGVPLTQYCDDNHLQPRERLELFVQVCDAVQHAHQKGVIHRDIKPSNVLVAEYDHHAVPKIIDFGVAKALNQQLTEKTMFTQYGQIVGTIEYMSPEQAKFNQLDIDTRSDIYSLGVLLYELMSGDTPFDRERLRSAAFDELIRIIREEEPPKPSVRLKSSATLPAIASARRMPAFKLGVLLQGELDWIIMKSLDKDRARRYDTARDFAMDVRRYLNNDPIVASPPSNLYRFQKFYRRHRTFVNASAMVILLLSVATIVAGAGWNQAHRASLAYLETIKDKEQAIADREEALARADNEAKRAENNETIAQREAAVAAAINEFINTELLGKIIPAEGDATGYDVTLKQVLDVAAKQLLQDVEKDGRFANNPTVAAALHQTIGKGYWSTGKIEDARNHLAKAFDLYSNEFGLKDRRIASVRLDQGRVAQLAGRVDRAKQLYGEAYDGFRASLGPDSVESLEAELRFHALRREGNTAADAEKRLREVGEKLVGRLGQSHPLSLICQFHLGVAIRSQGRREEGNAVCDQAMTMIEKEEIRDADTLKAMARVAWDSRDETRKLKYFKLAYEGLADTLGPEHPYTLNEANSYAAALCRQARYSEAFEHLNIWLPIAERTLPEPHVTTSLMRQNLGVAAYCIGDATRAIDLTKLSIEDACHVRPASLPTLLDNLTEYFQSADLHDEYREYLDEFSGVRLELVREGKFEYFDDMGHFAAWLTRNAKDPQSTIRLCQELFQTMPDAPDENEAVYAWLRCSLAEAMLFDGQYDDAEIHAAIARELLQENFSSDHWLHYFADFTLGEVRFRGGRRSEGIAKLIQAYEEIFRRNAPGHVTAPMYVKITGYCQVASEGLEYVVSRLERQVETYDVQQFKIDAHYVAVLSSAGDYEVALQCAENSIQRYRDEELVSPGFLGWALENTLFAAVCLSDYERAENLRSRLQEAKKAGFDEHQYWSYSHLPIVSELEIRKRNFSSARESAIKHLEHLYGVQTNEVGRIRSIECLTRLCLTDPDSLEAVLKALSELASQVKAERKKWAMDYFEDATILMLKLGRSDLATQYCLERLELQRLNHLMDAPEQHTSYALIAKSYLSRGDVSEARKWVEKVEAIENHWMTEYDPISVVGGQLKGRILLEQGHFEEAEVLMKGALEKHQLLSSGGATQFSVEREYVRDLIDLYERWELEDPGTGAGEKARVYRSKLSAYVSIWPNGEDASTVE